MGLTIRTIIDGAGRRDIKANPVGGSVSVQSTYPAVTVELEDAEGDWATAAIVDAVAAVSDSAARAFVTTVRTVPNEEVSL